jgi:two-component system sensor histidine kinase UhpB
MDTPTLSIPVLPKSLAHLFETFMTHVPACAWIKDLQGRYVYVNPMVQCLPGYDTSCIGRTDEEILPQVLAEQYQFNDRKVIESKMVLQTVEQFIADGITKHMLVNKFPILNEHGQVCLVAGWSIDGTPLLEAQQALHENQERLRIALNATNTGVWTWKLATGKLFWSPECHSLFGTRPEEFIAHADWFFDRVHPDDLSLVKQRVDEAIQNTTSYQAEFRIRHGSGEIRWMSGVGQVQRDAGGNVWRMVGIIQDITDRKIVEAELATSREQLRALAAHLEDIRESERTAMSRKVHDEIGQLLSGLKMDLRWIEKRAIQGTLPSIHNQVLEKIAAAVHLVDETIQTVQNIAVELRPGALDNLGLADALGEEARRFQERSSISIHLQLSDPPRKLAPNVSTAFFRIFQEMLINVARHSKATAVQVQFGIQSNILQLIVQDNGVGLSTITNHREGALGLLGMRERAAALGGEFTISSEPGLGTTATVRVPTTRLTQPLINA